MQRQVIEAEGFHNSFVTHMEGKTSKEVLTIKKDYAALVKNAKR